jgi:isoquinoline 1-oxidoreductase beta subunit
MVDRRRRSWRRRTFDDMAASPCAACWVTIDPKPPIGFQPLGGVAVIADSTWAAMQGRKALKIEWDLGQHAAYDSARYKDTLLAAVKQPGKVARSRGDVDAVFAKGGTVVEASYYVPHHAHATMEPPVAVADFRDGTLTAWAPVQNPQAAQDTIAGARHRQEQGSAT